jgi:hypothetical protein
MKQKWRGVRWCWAEQPAAAVVIEAAWIDALHHCCRIPQGRVPLAHPDVPSTAGDPPTPTSGHQNDFSDARSMVPA